MKKILQAREKILRQTAKEVPLSDIAKPKIKKVLKGGAERARERASKKMEDVRNKIGVAL